MSTKRIFKYPLEITDKQTIAMPANAELLSVQVQNQQLCLWALVDTMLPERETEIAIYGTGNPIPDNTGWHIDTCQLNGLVWHVFGF